MQYPKLVETKTSANEITTIEWNPGMDLLATVFSNGALTCSRLLSLQKVWNKQSSGQIASIAWRSDGRVLVIGAYNDKTKENVCTLHDVENGKTINTIVKDRAITYVSWFQHSSMNTDIDKDDSKRSSKKTMPLTVTSESFSHQLAHEQTNLSILVIATEDRMISFYALGLFYLGSVCAIGSAGVSIEPKHKIVKTHMSSCLRFITCIMTCKIGYSCCISMKVLKLDTFQKRNSEILQVAKMYAKITDELEYLDDTINAVTTSWADVLAGLDSKLSSYCSRNHPMSNKGRDGYTFLSADELLQLLVIGFPSDNVEKFLADMSDKGLKKLNNAIEQTCLRVQNLIVKNAQKCCYHLHADLNYLRGMSLWRERFEEVGLNDKFIVEAMRSVGSLVLKLTELQQVIDHSLKSTKSFFRWLISIACRMTGEQNNSVVPNDINKTTQQDIQLITDFILENFDYNSHQNDLDDLDRELNDCFVLPIRPTCSNFTLEQVGQYLKNEVYLSRQKYSFVKPNSNFWIEFFKQRPHLSESKVLSEDGSSAILFYPHNPHTSLIQEHKNTCKSIETAFKSVATNIQSILDGSDNFINLKNFVRNAPTDRIRIETDLKALKHYTLFQNKSGPINKQYLISQSLENKLFKLISIEFQSKGQDVHKPTTALLITDSDFYEIKETKKLLLTFLLLDCRMDDTLIVQLDLNKFIEYAKANERQSSDLTKVFKSNDSIEKYSTHVVLKLDIYTDPAAQRVNDLDMMVKKIKSTTGKDMFASSGRGVIAFTSCGNKRLHLYEMESFANGVEIMDDEIEGDDRIDESLIDTDLMS